MANRKGRRRFGWVRKLPSGRFQARYLGPDGRRRVAPETFERKGDAGQWLSTVESDMLRGEWTDPLLGRVRFGEYGERWIAEHPLGARTREEYQSLWRHHVAPFLGHVELAELSTGTIRTWRATLLREGRSEDRTAKAYRLVRAILTTAVDDGRIKRNPCRIKGAGEHRTAERPTATVTQVYALANRMPGRYRVLVLAAAFTGLRWGQLIALRRCDVDLISGVLHVRRRLAQLSRGGMQEGAPKSAADVRNVALPEFLVDELRSHLAEYAGNGPEGLVFREEKGAMLRRGNFGRVVKWSATVTAAGLPAGFHFHGLRHTGNQLAVNAGAITRELMHRMGHGSMRAALIYQHATPERDRRIADALGALVDDSRAGTAHEGQGGDEDDDGASGVLVPVAQ
ncbi:tyrosine-type recombinase/integrase [Pseudonocardia sp. H11422]|uniref:tyrosine-type recombinase/integrase n=1 Tax=Pseudonocardia sp. H11422 TaxID=2835866 RepID=UPI001BDD24C2|nr:site-specific integrase [Pseudonocardia sp. H11422]